MLNEENNEKRLNMLKCNLPPAEWDQIWQFIRENCSEFPPDMQKTQGYYVLLAKKEHMETELDQQDLKCFTMHQMGLDEPEDYTKYNELLDEYMGFCETNQLIPIELHRFFIDIPIQIFRVIKFSDWCPKHLSSQQLDEL